MNTPITQAVVLLKRFSHAKKSHAKPSNRYNVGLHLQHKNTLVICFSSLALVNAQKLFYDFFSFPRWRIITIQLSVAAA